MNSLSSDILSARFVLEPTRFDVVVASNLFGDILSDLGPACTGTIGVAPSANLNPERKFPSLFEPVHGSAPMRWRRCRRTTGLVTWRVAWQGPRPSWLLLQLEVPLATCLAWVQAASARGVRVMLNAAPMMALPASLLECVDTLVVNEGELAALDGAVADIDTALAAAAGLGPQRVVVTLGAAGCRAVDANGLLHVAGTKVDVVDTTGAGDTFVGALAAGLDAGLTFDLALQRANVAAALSCAVVGARGGMPDGVALMKAMKAMDAMR